MYGDWGYGAEKVLKFRQGQDAKIQLDLVFHTVFFLKKSFLTSALKVILCLTSLAKQILAK